MTSHALQRWNSQAQAELDELEAAHKAIGGSGRGRRYATLQVNHAYTALLSAQFQGFCRNLHSEAVDFITQTAQPLVLAPIVKTLLTQGRKLDSGNPNPGNLGADFGRLGMTFWKDVLATDPTNAARHAELETLNTWRNAIAHQDWSKVGGPNLRLTRVRNWRRVCRTLAVAFDQAVAGYLTGLAGSKPW